MADIVLFGAGDIARLALHYFTTDSVHRVVAATVDREYRTTETFEGLPLVPFDEVAARYPAARYAMFIALSYAKVNRLRAERCAQARALGYELVSYVSSRCTYLSAEPPGDNGFILEDNTIQPFVRIGANVTLWSGNHVGHDSVIEDDCFISSHVVISGHVTVGRRCFLGVNATLFNGITLGEGTVAGAGAVLARGTEPGSVYLAPRAQRAPMHSDEVDL